MKNNPAFIFFFIIVIGITSCAPAPMFHTHQIETWPKPVLQVYVRPDGILDFRNSSALIGRVRLFLQDKQSVSEAMARQIKDVLLQSRIFRQIEVVKEETAGKDVFATASEKGIDYVIAVEIPHMLAPAGNTPGWLALDMKIIRTKDQVVFWSSYAEVNLEMRHGQNYIIYERPYSQAPSLSQGLDAIIREIARAIVTM